MSVCVHARACVCSSNYLARVCVLKYALECINAVSVKDAHVSHAPCVKDAMTPDPMAYHSHIVGHGLSWPNQLDEDVWQEHQRRLLGRHGGYVMYVSASSLPLEIRWASPIRWSRYVFQSGQFLCLG